MTAVRPLLVELLVEELPPKALKKLSAAFAEALVGRLQSEGLVDAAAKRTEYATPRRLAVLVDAVAERAADRRVTQKLMPVAVGLTAAGEPTPALAKKLAALGAGADAVAKLERRIDAKSEVLFLDTVEPGATLAEGLQRALDAALAALPIPKVMQYQLADGWTTVSFVRPAHRLVALHGSDVVAVSALGLDAGRTTQGHRFEAAVPTIELRDAAGYAAHLRDEGAVIASFEARRAEIDAQLLAAAGREGLTPIDDDALRDEVTALVERPNVLTCRFDDAFLAVPAECLVLTMKANQKYFPLLDAEDRLTSRFLVVSNIRPADPANVVAGNERVVRPRLADAKFFFDQDRKRSLASRVTGLDAVVYHRKLGSQGERVRRLRQVARWIAERIGADPALAERAALLAKADLLTDMVGEFPELQGTMGRYYALAEGEGEVVAFAIDDHYRPRFSGDALPRSDVGVAVALADKLETIAGLFAAGERPTGDKDPFALRRNALGIVRLLVERGLPLSLVELFATAIAMLPGELAKLPVAEPVGFVVERARGYFVEQGLAARAVDAVLVPAGGGTILSELMPIARAADRFMASEEGRELAAANKRITNILRKSGFEVPVGFSPRDLKQQADPALFAQDEERALHEALRATGTKALELREQGRYAESLAALSPLHEPVRAFFDRVMVNADDTRLRDNRITLLQHARAYMNQVAELGMMAS
jgi:glycyl-tRNA synthetase beta chain